MYKTSERMTYQNNDSTIPENYIHFYETIFKLNVYKRRLEMSDLNRKVGEVCPKGYRSLKKRKREN